MALVNLAVELAQNGKRVLAVDFDLEAPGLDTYPLGSSEHKSDGIVDFVTRYLDTGQAPHVENYVYRSDIVGADGGGELLVMPSGSYSRSYATRYAEIDWAKLYAERDGFLLFEDLRQQWNKFLELDYVLIDSRTGHTDTGGICTRQLPDAVVILFLPNEQNLRGLRGIVRGIRAEGKPPRNKAISLHFVMSNIPDLDDEDGILEDHLKDFRKVLRLRDYPHVIHRYDSLELLNQAVFVRDRPKSRLAKEYRELLTKIIRLNPGDREGALAYIEERGRPAFRYRQRRYTRDIGWLYRDDPDEEDHLREIEENHGDDGEVLFRLASLESDRGKSDKAYELCDISIEAAGYCDPAAFLLRASIGSSYGDEEGARQDAESVLESDGVSVPDIRRAIRFIRHHNPEIVLDSKAVASLDPVGRVHIAADLNRSQREAQVACKLLEPAIEKLAATQLARHRRRAIDELVLCTIAIGSFGKAVQAFESQGLPLDKMGIQDAFNYGMALWGKTGCIDRFPFQRVLELDQMSSDQDDPNCLQCMAVANWVAGRPDEAGHLADRAEDALLSSGRHHFSCWRYLRVSAKQFRADLEELRKMICGEQAVRPAIFSS